MSAWLSRFGIWVFVGVFVLMGAFAAGRYTAADPEVREVERVEYRDRVITVTKVERQEARTRVVYRTVTPDGTRTEIEREETRVTENTNTATDHASEGTRVAERTVTPRQPDWRVGVMVGVNLQLAPQVGAVIERRILGPVWLGLWVLVRPSPTFNLAGGASVGLEF